MKIAIDGASCQLLTEILSQHRDGQSRLLWKKYDYELSEKYRTVAAVPLLKQLCQESRVLRFDGDQRDLLLRLLAWAALSNRAWEELMAIKGLLAMLQPQGTPLKAEIGDHVVIKQSGVLVEIVCFNGGLQDDAEDGYFVTDVSTGFIVCAAYANPEDADLQYVDCSLDDLMWPAPMSPEAIIWGPFPHRIAA